MGNRIGKEMRSKLQEIMCSKPNLISLCGIADDTTEVDLSGLGMDADDAIILASELPDKRALSSLILKSNGILNKESGRALAQALKDNSVLTVLDVSNNWSRYNGASQDGAGFVQEFAVGIKDNGALTSLDISDNILCGLYSDGSGTFNGAGVAALSDLLKVNSVLKELKMSRTYIGSEGAKVLSLGLSGNGALSLLNVASNALLAEGTKLLAAALKGNQIMTELNISSNVMTYGSAWGDISGVVALADVIPDMRALSSLDLSSNGLGELPPGWTAHVDPASQQTYYAKEGETSQWVHPGGIGVVADAIKNMGALITLDISSNRIGAEQKGGLQRICVASGIDLAM
jgi:hypothetical protein